MIMHVRQTVQTRTTDVLLTKVRARAYSECNRRLLVYSQISGTLCVGLGSERLIKRRPVVTSDLFASLLSKTNTIVLP